MSGPPLRDFIRRLCAARDAAEAGHLTDAELIDRFVRRRDEAAFEVLVWRHGALVLGVARRLVRDADAEDVFQATFLTLARKAVAIRRRTALAGWLYKVAYRIGLRVRQAEARRGRHERPGVEALAKAAPLTAVDAEVRAALAEEVGRLPDRYRGAVVLCYLQGLTTAEAARVLGCPPGTVLSRLAWARGRLRSRLARRGLAPAAALVVASLGEADAAAPPQVLVASVVRAALPFAAGRTVPTGVSPRIAALARGALQTMLWTKVKMIVAAAVVVGLAGTGAGWLARGRGGAEAAPPAAEQPRTPPQAEGQAGADRERRARIARIHAALDVLAAESAKQEEALVAEVVRARLQVMAAEERLHAKEREYAFGRERERARLKALGDKVAATEAAIRELEQKVVDTNAKRVLERFAEQHDRAQKALREAEELALRSEAQRYAEVLDLRQELLPAEERLRLVQRRQAARMDEMTARRQALLERLRELQGEAPEDASAARLRELERKIDALRREVGELRRGLERRRPGAPDKDP